MRLIYLRCRCSHNHIYKDAMKDEKTLKGEPRCQVNIPDNSPSYIEITKQLRINSNCAMNEIKEYCDSTEYPKGDL